MTVEFEITREVGVRSCSSSTLFRRPGFPVRPGSEVTITNKENATTSGQIRMEALLILFKQTLQAGDRAAGLDSIQGQSSLTGRPVSEPCVEWSRREALHLFYFIAKRVNDFSDYFVLVLLVFCGEQSQGKNRPGAISISTTERAGEALQEFLRSYARRHNLRHNRQNGSEGVTVSN
jgi:hypothetical protein